MEKEISSGTMLGIVLIALAVVIGLGFGIFALAKGTANDGVVNMQENLGLVAQSQFDDYDQKTITGTQVMGAYKNFAGKPYAVLIATQAYIDGNTVVNGNVVKAFGGVVGSTTTQKATKSDGTTVVDLKPLNYNALLAGNIYLDKGYYVTSGGFNSSAAGDVSFYTISENMNKRGAAEYVSSGSRFQANLIKDGSGTTIGLVFRQVGTR